MASTAIFFVLIITMDELMTLGSTGGSAYMGNMTSTKKRLQWVSCVRQTVVSIDVFCGEVYEQMLS